MKKEPITTAPRRAPTLALLLAFALTGARAQSRKSQSVLPQQQPPAPRQPASESRSSTMRVELGAPVAETPVPFEGDFRAAPALSFVTPDTSFDRKLVKDSPFSADAVTESVQTLNDGNRMVRKSAARIFRDAAGRTRREHTLDRRGGQTPVGDEPQLVVINDPVAQVNYIVETVRRVETPPGLMEARQRAMGGGGGGDASFGVLMPASAAHRRAAQGDDAPAPPKPVREKLGSQLIEGVQAEGTRTTLTIPAGEFDNEQAMEITHEQWYSPELQMVVLMKHNDPRFGETIFRLTNVARGEQDRSLFEPPRGYKVVSGREPFPFPGRPRPTKP
ncbi:MAG: hypothetical protein LC785_09885 [Acidobacteria bacterium]|nr:hypothetical protein [Acidobacteriota bacterium]MCA1642239.1 hypothetical protein [Acidobacteriota bacterium]